MRQLVTGEKGCCHHRSGYTLLNFPEVQFPTRVVGSGANTIPRWLKLLEFQKACPEARPVVSLQPIGRLQ